jgi:uncharacterized membrane protein YhaH (DUF805 family)
MEWMILPLKRYADFQGRSQRMEYWMFFLFNIIVRLVLSLIDSALGLGGHTATYSTHAPGSFSSGAMTSGGILSGVYGLAVLVPSLAVGVRRLHDIDRTGWWLLAPFVLVAAGAALFFPFLDSSGATGFGGMGLAGGLLFFLGGIMGLVLFVWTLFDGTRGPNRFGPDPKGGIDDLHETFR